MRKILSLILSLGLLFQQAGFSYAAGQLNLANYLSSMHSAIIQPDRFRPPQLRYISYDLKSDDFKLLLDKGDLKQPKEQNGSNDKLLTQELLNYFLIGLSLPNDTFWVNLRPDAADNIIDPLLEKTDIGKIFLEADLQLKKDTASFTSPQTSEGKAYWDKLYKKAGELFGTENITIPTITRPWIVPNEVIVRETEDSAYIYKATLKVMLEEDYLRGMKDDSAGGGTSGRGTINYSFNDPRLKELNEYSTKLLKELIIPKLTQEVNSSQRYAKLRQVYYSLVLSRWFKMKYNGKPGEYPELIDRQNLTNLASKQAWDKQTYFSQYRESFAKGEYNLKETVASGFGQSIRSYVSGGVMVDSPIIPGVVKVIGLPEVTKALTADQVSVGSPLTTKQEVDNLLKKLPDEMYKKLSADEKLSLLEKVRKATAYFADKMSEYSKIAESLFDSQVSRETDELARPGMGFSMFVSGKTSNYLRASEARNKFKGLWEEACYLNDKLMEQKKEGGVASPIIIFEKHRDLIRKIKAEASAEYKEMQDLSVKYANLGELKELYKGVKAYYDNNDIIKMIEGIKEFYGLVSGKVFTDTYGRVDYNVADKISKWGENEKSAHQIVNAARENIKQRIEKDKKMLLWLPDETKEANFNYIDDMFRNGDFMGVADKMASLCDLRRKPDWYGEIFEDESFKYLEDKRKWEEIRQEVEIISISAGSPLNTEEFYLKLETIYENKKIFLDGEKAFIDLIDIFSQVDQKAEFDRFGVIFINEIVLQIFKHKKELAAHLAPVMRSLHSISYQKFKTADYDAEGNIIIKIEEVLDAIAETLKVNKDERQYSISADKRASFSAINDKFISAVRQAQEKISQQKQAFVGSPLTVEQKKLIKSVMRLLETPEISFEISDMVKSIIAEITGVEVKTEDMVKPLNNLIEDSLSQLEFIALLEKSFGVDILVKNQADVAIQSKKTVKEIIEDLCERFGGFKDSKQIFSAMKKIVSADTNKYLSTKILRDLLKQICMVGIKDLLTKVRNVGLEDVRMGIKGIEEDIKDNKIGEAAYRLGQVFLEVGDYKNADACNSIRNAWQSAAGSPLTGVSSAVDMGKDVSIIAPKRGGIDLTERAMSIGLERVGSFASSPLTLPEIKNPQAIDLDNEFRQIQAMIGSSIRPSDVRILEFAAACYYKDEFDQRLAQVSSCIKAAHLADERLGRESSPALRLATMLPDALYAYGEY